jgi:hypothetical protein
MLMISRNTFQASAKRSYPNGALRGAERPNEGVTHCRRAAKEAFDAERPNEEVSLTAENAEGAEVKPGSSSRSTL